MNFYNIYTEQHFIVWLGVSNGVITGGPIDPVIEFIYTLKWVAPPNFPPQLNHAMKAFYHIEI